MWIFLASQMLAVLAIYEYIITWPQEASIIWRRKWTVATVLLLFTRWVVLAMAILRLQQPLVRLPQISFAEIFTKIASSRRKSDPFLTFAV
jgi:hypothetical protein